MSAEAENEFPRTPLPDGPRPGIGALGEMFDELAAAPEVYRPTEFWREYVELHLQQLGSDGFDEFKRTVNRNYFQFQLGDPRHPLTRRMWSHWLRSPSLAPLRASYANGFGYPPIERRRDELDRWLYPRYIALLFDFVSERDTRGLLEGLEEPALGHPICIDLRGHRVSEDLCNSVMEFTAVADAVPVDALEEATVVELGSGYGRLAWLYLNAVPTLRYVLVDIPPALAIAEQYLATLLPDRRIFGFRRFSDEQEVADELTTADIVFLTPNQLDLLPSLRADLFINVSSLHEMTPVQIDHYFDLIERHTAGGLFYTKQWLRSVNAADDVVIERSQYPVRDAWEAAFDRIHPVNPLFFEALYKLP
jgi:putative sugar O-methyltransferase